MADQHEIQGVPGFPALGIGGAAGQGFEQFTQAIDVRVDGGFNSLVQRVV